MSSVERFTINSSKITHELIDGEVVIINFDSGNYYCLNSTGADVWSLIEKKVSIADMTAMLEQKFDATVQEIQASLESFVTTLKTEMLILESEAGSTTAQDSQANLGERLPFEAPALQKFDDMQELILLDPIHEVDNAGWPRAKQADAGSGQTNGTID